VSELVFPYGEQTTAPLAIDGAMMRHQIGDTKYRQIGYSAVATSRYTEFVDPARQTPDHVTVSTPADKILVADILSSERPDPPDVAYVIPSFGWIDQPSRVDPVSHDTTVGRLRIAGLRILLRRPWYSSGAGEQLAVVLLPDGDAHYVAKPFLELDDRFRPYVSQWGHDPLWKTAGQIRSGLTPELFSNATQIAQARLPEIGLESPITVVAFAPTFDEKRQLHVGDVALDSATLHMPFLRLALCRYQPNSIADCELSRVMLADMMQLPANRSVSVMYAKNGRELRVALTGGAATSTIEQHRIIVDVLLERRNPHDEHAWEPSGLSPIQTTTESALWNGTFELPDRFHTGRFRLIIREWEQYGPGENDRRPIYAEQLEL